MTSHEAKIIKSKLQSMNKKTMFKNDLIDWYIELENETMQHQNISVEDLMKVAESAGIVIKQNIVTFEGVPSNFIELDKKKKAEKVLTKENLQKLINEGYPQIDIAEKLGVTRGQVQYALKKYGLEAPTMKEKVAALYKQGLTYPEIAEELKPMSRRSICAYVSKFRRGIYE